MRASSTCWRPGGSARGAAPVRVRDAQAPISVLNHQRSPAGVLRSSPVLLTMAPHRSTA